MDQMLPLRLALGFLVRLALGHPLGLLIGLICISRWWGNVPMDIGSAAVMGVFGYLIGPVGYGVLGFVLDLIHARASSTERL